MPVPSLPIELVEKIVEELRPYIQEGWRVALVCRDWLDLGRALLYRGTPIVLGQVDPRHQTLRKFPHLRQVVRHVEFKGDLIFEDLDELHPRDEDGNVLVEASLREFAQRTIDEVLSILPCIVRVEFNKFDYFSMPLALTSLTRSAAASQIRRIGWHRSAGEKERTLYPFGWVSNTLLDKLQVFSSLDDLTLAADVGAPRIPVYDMAPPVLQLRRFEVMAPEGASVGGSSNMILTACRKTLESLYVVEIDLGPQELCACLFTVPPYSRLATLVVYLNLAHQHTDLSPNLKRLLKTLPALRCLRLHAASPVIAVYVAELSILGFLPASMEMMEVAVKTKTSIQALLKRLQKEGKLKHLKMLSYLGADGKERIWDLGAASGA